MASIKPSYEQSNCKGKLNKNNIPSTRLLEEKKMGTTVMKCQSKYFIIEQVQQCKIFGHTKEKGHFILSD